MNVIAICIEFLRKKWILQPVLLSLYVVLFGIYEVDSSTIEISKSLIVFGVIVLYWSIAFLLLKILLRDNVRSSYITSFVIFSTMFFMGIRQIFSFVVWVRARHILLLIVLIFLGLLIKAIRAKNKRQPSKNQVIYYLNVLFLLFNIQVIVSIIYKVFTKHASIQVIDKQQSEKSPLPDIYLIVFDGYANQNSLKKHWNFDNSLFLKQLSDLGFYNAKNAKSNYIVTVETVGSMLDLGYLENSEKRNGIRLLNKIKQNQTIRILKEKGYRIHNFSVTNIDETINPYTVSFFSDVSILYTVTLSRSIFLNLSGYIFEPVFPELKREKNILKKLRTVIKAKSQSPKFVYYHSMITHYPYYLDEKGRVSKEIEKQNATNKIINNWVTNTKGYNTLGSASKDSLWMKSYLNHLLYSNTLGLKLVKEIINENQTPPIIVLMSDHGFRLITNRSFRETESEAYSNLCTIYFPDKTYKKLYDSITPINVMRVILNKSLGTRYEPLADRSGL